MSSNLNVTQPVLRTSPNTLQTLPVWVLLTAGAAIPGLFWAFRSGISAGVAVSTAVVFLYGLALVMVKSRISQVIQSYTSGMEDLQSRLGSLQNQLVSARDQLRDEEEKRQTAEQILSRTVEVEKALLAITTRLVESAENDDSIKSALQSLGTATQSSRVALYRVHKKSSTIEATHSWIEREPGVLDSSFDSFRTGSFPRFEERLAAGEVVYIPDTLAMPEDAGTERSISATGAKSLLLLPIRVSGKVDAVLSMSSDSRVENYSDEDRSVLSLFAEILGAALSRVQLQEQLQQSQKMEAVGRLAGGMAHDFNNILTVIMAYTEFMLTGKATPEHDVSEIRKAAERASSLIRHLLAFSRRQVMQLQNLDLNDLLSSTEKMLKRLIGEDIIVQTRLGEHVGRIKADPIQLEQAIFNLAVNARDAMPGGGKLTIVTQNVEQCPDSEGPHVLLSIADTGCGMSDEVRAHMFEPFFTTKKKGEGTGLGLSTVYGIVKQSEGHITVTSKVGVGTTFNLYFPRADTPGTTTEPGSVCSCATKGGESILVVEDETMVRELIEHSLTRYDYRVVAASCPEEAIRVCKESPERFDLMLTDVIMPQMGGGELAQVISGIRPGIKILYMSGYLHTLKDIPDPSSALFIQKPFTPDSLAQRVRDILDGTAAG